MDRLPRVSVRMDRPRYIEVTAAALKSSAGAAAGATEEVDEDGTAAAAVVPTFPAPLASAAAGGRWELSVEIERWSAGARQPGAAAAGGGGGGRARVYAPRFPKVSPSRGGWGQYPLCGGVCRLWGQSFQRTQGGEGLITGS